VKRFDSEAIFNRLMDRMEVNLNWALLSQNGVISAMMDAFSDRLAEISRYAEYLLGEKKWTTAQNVSSLNSQVGLVGYKSHRMQSAISYVVVSHTDQSGANRLINYGNTFFSLDDRSNFDNITEDPDPQDPLRTQALAPWTNSTPYIIPLGTVFTSAGGVQFVSTQAVAIRTLTEPYDVIANSASRYAAFLAAGGWNGIKYLKVPVIQGSVQTVTLGTAQGTRFEAMLLPVTNCEDATNNVSSGFLQMMINPTPLTPGAARPWVQTSNILLAGPLDYVFEVSNMPDFSAVIFKFGDGINGQRLPAGALVTLSYLQTAGSGGNISQKYQVTSLSFPQGIQMIDPRTNTISNFLNVTNDHPILGGKDADDQEAIRTNAPISYLESYALATTESYEKQILQYAPIGLDKVKVFAGNATNLLTLIGNTTNTTRGPLVTGISQSVLYVTAISSNGEVLENAQDTFVNPVTRAIGNLKAPTDTLVYIDPELIQLRLSATVFSDDTSESDQDIITAESTALEAAYSIFSMDFKTPFYSSEFGALTQSFPFVSHTDSMVEARAAAPLQVSNITFPSVSTSPTGNNINPNGNTAYPILYKIGFSFNPIFGSNPYAQGFANFNQSAPYLIRLDLQFINNPVAAASLNRTFFLFDNRASYDPSLASLTAGAPEQNALSINAAKYYNQDGGAVVTNGAIFTDWVRPDETLNGFNNRAARVAQYAYISNITDAAFMAGAKNFSVGPFEIRPYYVDSQGNNQIFTAVDVKWPTGTADPRVMLPGNVQCYVKDPRYIDFLDINFLENYNQPASDIFATGSFVIPAGYFGFTNIDITNEKEFVGALSNFISIKVVARPLLTDLEPQDWNEIIFVDSSDIVIERAQTTAATTTA
jgi:hypothetical protein